MFNITVSYGQTTCQLLFKNRESADNVWGQLRLTPITIPTEYGSGLNPAVGVGIQVAPGVIDAFPNVVSPTITVEDDFGRTLVVIGSSITGLIFEDMDKTKEGVIVQSIHQAKVQIEANKRANSDPQISSMQRLMGGPAVLNPMINNGH